MTREEIFNKSYEMGYDKAVDDFAKWLVDKGVLGSRVIVDGEIIDYGTLYAKQFKKETLKRGGEE